MTSFQRASVWLGIALLLAAGDIALLFVLSHRGIGPLALLLIGGGIPVLFLMVVTLVVPTRCSNCRLPLGFGRRITQMLRGRATAPHCARCRR
jgi:hypothetical protein